MDLWDLINDAIWTEKKIEKNISLKIAMKKKIISTKIKIDQRI
jgi:hypothetical protein